MIANRHYDARLQSDFYRDRYHFFLKVLLAEAGLIVFLILAVFYVVLFHGSPQYYVTTSRGSIISLTASQ